MNPGWSVSLHSYTKLFENGLKLSMNLVNGHVAITIEITRERLGVDVIRNCLNYFLVILLGTEHTVDIDGTAKECADFFHFLAQSNDAVSRCIIEPVHLIGQPIPTVEHATILDREMICNFAIGRRPVYWSGRSWLWWR